MFETQSYVSADAAWHQALTFDKSCAVMVVVENLGKDPIYGFYLNENDFNVMTATGSVDDAIMSRIQEQLLCENEDGIAEVEVRFLPGKYFICVELDCQSQPDARRTEFRLRLHEKC